jgi:hypothetical protein
LTLLGAAPAHCRVHPSRGQGSISEKERYITRKTTICGNCVLIIENVTGLRTTVGEVALAHEPTERAVTVRQKRSRDSIAGVSIAPTAPDGPSTRAPTVSDGAFVDVTNPLPPTVLVIGVAAAAIAVLLIVGLFTFALWRHIRP